MIFFSLLNFCYNDINGKIDAFKGTKVDFYIKMFICLLKKIKRDNNRKIRIIINKT